MPYDILLDENDDILIENGDFVIGESSLQHQRLLLLCNKGELKESPMRAVGVSRYLEGEDPQSLAREIDIDFSRDGMRVEAIKIDIPHIEIKASYD